MSGTVEARGSFTGRLGFILAAAGSAIGLGNLWRFPYLAEEYGGGIFLLVYLVLVVTFGVTLMMVEVAIGRRTGKSCIDAFMDLCQRYRFVGWLAALVPMLIVPYYCVIGGWVTKYFVEYATGSGSELSGGSFFGDFTSMSMDGLFDSPMVWFLVYAVLTVLVVAFGVEKGVERISKILLPFLFVLLIGICVYMMTLPGISEGLSFYLMPDLDQFSMKTVLAALGQLFYSLSLAMGIMITYGSYMRKEVSIARSSRTISLMDTSMAFLSGLMVIPAVVVFSGAGMSSGPGLMFETLPLVFDSMPAGQVIGAAFFLLTMIAALTSSISLAETVVSVMKDHLGWRRTVACGACMALILVLGTLSCAGYGPLEGVQIMGRAFLDFFDFITNSLLMPVVALLTCVVVGHVIDTRIITDEIRQGGEFRFERPFVLMVKWVCPVLLLVILVSGLLDTFGIYSI